MRGGARWESRLSPGWPQPCCVSEGTPALLSGPHMLSYRRHRVEGSRPLRMGSGHPALQARLQRREGRGPGGRRALAQLRVERQAVEGQRTGLGTELPLADSGEGQQLLDTTSLGAQTPPDTHRSRRCLPTPSLTPLPEPTYSSHSITRWTFPLLSAPNRATGQEAASRHLCPSSTPPRPSGSWEVWGP